MNLQSKSRSNIIQCAARNCYNTSSNRPTLKFFQFPKVHTYARVWAENCKREDIASKPISVMMRYSLCAEHFHDKFFNIYYEPKTVFRKDLQPIPTIFNTTQEVNNTEDPLDIKFWKDSKEDILLGNYTTTYVNLPLELPEDVGPDMEFGKLNYTENLYEEFVSNPNVLNVQTDLTDRLILRDYCRLCAKQLPIASLIPIFDTNKFLNYGDMLEYILPGLFKKDDEYPQQICSLCIGKLETAYNTLKTFRQSNRIFENIFDTKTDNFNDETIESVKGVSNLLNTFERKSLITVGDDSITELSTQTTNIENNENNINNINEEVQIKYQCSVCSKLFNDENEIRDHSKLKHFEIKNKSFRIVKVKLCKKKDKIATNTNNTKTQKDPQSKANTNIEKFYYIHKHQCTICYKVYRKMQQLIYHTKDRHPELEKPQSKIVKAKKKFVVTSNLLSTTRYECLQCHTQHRSKETLLKHTRLHHPALNNEKVVCRILKSKKYRNHSITCLRCSESFETINNYRIHMAKHAIYKCEECGIIFDKFYKLRSHKKIHNIPMHNCKECNLAFHNKRDLAKHEEIHIDNELKKHMSNKSALCNICGKLYPSEQQLLLHLQIHSDLRPFKCTVCHKAFKTGPNLANHRECHALEKKYVCQFCGKLFRTKNTLKQHLVLHEDVKKYTCHICGAKFNRKGNLVKHMERHNIINDVYACKSCDTKYNNYHSLVFHACSKVSKQVSCPTCKKTFPGNYLLKIHERLHSGETPFQCDKHKKIHDSFVGDDKSDDDNRTEEGSNVLESVKHGP